MRLSVCMITYNHEKFIEQAATSVLDQDVDFNYEIIVGDDASTDGTSAILHRLESLHPERLKIFSRKENIGSRENLYQTIAACTGEYIAFLEGDDFWTSRDKLKLQVDFLDRHPDASFCFHRTRSLNMLDDAEEYFVPSVDPPEFSSIDFLLQDSNPVAVGTVVARRACMRDLSTWLADLRPGDWPLCLMLAKKGRVGYLPLEMARYRVHAGGLWTSKSPMLRIPIVVRMLSHVSGLLTGDDKELLESRKKNLVDWWAGELLCNPSIPLEPLLDDIKRLDDPALLTYLLSRLAEKGRLIREGSIWHEQRASAFQREYEKLDSSAAKNRFRFAVGWAIWVRNFFRRAFPRKIL